MERIPYTDNAERESIIAEKEAEGKKFMVDHIDQSGNFLEFGTQDEYDEREVETARSQIRETDPGFIRVIEDVIELLISKGVVKLDELPNEAQDKFLDRQILRQKM